MQSKIPEQEKWLLKNKKALSSVLNGIEQSGKGEVKFLGSYEKYAQEALDPRLRGDDSK
ncbi:MAG: hypothetical protein ABL867_08490 [Rickettsiales bacterium]